MKKPDLSPRAIATAGVIAAVYAALCLFLAPIAYGPWQFRPGEAMTLLPLILPAAVPGLTIGCVIANLASPFGLIDIVCGSAATLMAALITRQIGNKLPLSRAVWLAPLPPVIANAVIIGGVLTTMLAPDGGLAAFATFALEVGVSEAAVCYIIGVPLVFGVSRVVVRK